MSNPVLPQGLREPVGRSWWLIEWPQAHGTPLWWSGLEDEERLMHRLQQDSEPLGKDEVYANFTVDANRAVRFVSQRQGYAVLKRLPEDWRHCIVTEHLWMDAALAEPLPPSPDDTGRVDRAFARIEQYLTREPFESADDAASHAQRCIGAVQQILKRGAAFSTPALPPSDDRGQTQKVALQAIATFKPRPEIVYDQFAYDRLLAAIQEVAANALSAPPAVPPETA